MNPLLLRSTERLLALLIGALSIYLGYDLFLKLAELSEVLSKGKGTFELGGAKIVLSHVGPGVFFALFGAVVVWLSLRMQMSYSRQEVFGPKGPVEKNVTFDAASPDKVTQYSGVALTYLNATERVVDDQAIRSAQSRLLRDFRAMDRVCSALAKADRDEPIAVSKNERTDFIIAVPRLKEALMLTVWNSDWGDYAAFSEWVRAGCGDPPPKGSEAPARFYLGKPD